MALWAAICGTRMLWASGLVVDEVSGEVRWQTLAGTVADAPGGTLVEGRSTAMSSGAVSRPGPPWSTTARVGWLVLVAAAGLGVVAHGAGMFVPEFLASLGAFLSVNVVVAAGGILLWSGRRMGAVLALAPLPLEVLFWLGYALPLPPLIALLRTTLVAAAWHDLRSHHGST